MPKRLRRPRCDSGMTLVEMLVAMLVFSVAVTLVYGAVIFTMRTMNESQQSSDAVTEARLALATIDRQVRSGNVLYSPEKEPGLYPAGGCSSVPGTNSGTCMRIFTQSNGDQKCVQWQVLDDGTGKGTADLRVRSWETTYPAGDATDWSVAARGLVLGTDQPFTLLGADSPYDERLLRVQIDVRDERTDGTSSIVSSLAGRNTSYGYDTGQCEPVPNDIP